MAVYAALLSLNSTINQIQQHPSPPISLDQQQLHSLTENLSFLQNFLETYSTDEDEYLESRIAEAAYAAEDLIESHIVDQIDVRSTCHGENISCLDFYQGLERVIQDMDLIKKEIMNMGPQHHQLLSMFSSLSINPVRPVSRILQNNTLVDFGDILNDIMYKLTRQDSNFEIIPIVGMGGMGKTTLAKTIYAHPVIVQHFLILAWATISQEYSPSNILSQVLSEENKGGQVHELGERVHKKLYGMRYLIVLDDIWNIEAWDKVKSFFPKNNNGSKIMITTRNSKLAFQLSDIHDFKMKFLDDDKSWDLMCKIVFGKEGCPIELENIGKEIARNCRGLPLSIVVIGGLLAKSNMTHEHWEYTLKNLSSLINLENKEHCLQILRTSYKELPIHLKPCFLYMGIYPEDYAIRVCRLKKMFVAEGFLKPTQNKTLEEVAKGYINELIDRNLILVDELSRKGTTKSCNIHDLLRDICIRESKKQRFLCVLREQDLSIPEDINTQRRICVHGNISKGLWRQIKGSLIRSFILFRSDRYTSPPSPCRLLRVYARVGYGSSFDPKPAFEKANLRYFSMYVYYEPREFSTSWQLLWNQQTLEYLSQKGSSVVAPADIWKMPHLRHVMFSRLELPNPPCGKDNFVLESLQTLSDILNFKCSEEVVKRIPNIRKLKLFYDGDRVKEEGWGLHSFCLNNLAHLRNLKSLDLVLRYDVDDPNPRTMQNLSLPHSLKNLSLSNTFLLWEDLNTKIGSLPLLEFLKLEENSCIGPEWETMEGRFCSLKSLHIVQCGLQCWTTDDTHFPRLEHLRLQGLMELEEIPLCIGDIQTLQSIELDRCLKSAVDSAKRIKEEQLSYGNEDLQITVFPKEGGGEKSLMILLMVMQKIVKLSYTYSETDSMEEESRSGDDE